MCDLPNKVQISSMILQFWIGYFVRKSKKESFIGVKHEKKI